MSDGLAALRPEPVAWFELARRRAWECFDPALLELVRLRIGRLVGDVDGEAFRTPGTGLAEEKIRALPAYPTSPLYAERERACIAFVEQFVIDVGGTGDLGDLGVADGELAEFVRAVFVLEFGTRLRLTSAALLDPAPSAAITVPALDSIKSILDEYQAAVVRDTALDPVTAELVRLRCARTHHCRICQTLRLGAARDAGVDDTMTAKIDFYERSDLPERAKVALRVTDAFITGVAAPPDVLRAQARATFTPLELASLCLEIPKWSTQKIHVALGTDGADRLTVDETGVAVFDFASDGRVAGFRAQPAGR